MQEALVKRRVKETKGKSGVTNLLEEVKHAKTDEEVKEQATNRGLSQSQGEALAKVVMGDFEEVEDRKNLYKKIHEMVMEDCGGGGGGGDTTDICGQKAVTDERRMRHIFG